MSLGAIVSTAAARETNSASKQSFMQLLRPRGLNQTDRQTLLVSFIHLLQVFQAVHTHGSFPLLVSAPEPLFSRSEVIFIA